MTLGFIGKFYLVGVTVEARLWRFSGARVLDSALGALLLLESHGRPLCARTRHADA